MKITQFSALSVILTGFVACGGSEGKEPPGGEHGGTIVVAMAAEPEHLFPPTIPSLQAKIVVDQIFEPLAWVGSDGNTLGDTGFRPGVADRWTWNTDSTALDLHLDSLARWHDGRPVIAADVVFTWEMYHDKAVSSQHAGAFPAVDSLRAPDPQTVRVWFSDKTPERFFKLVTNLSVLPSHALAGVDRAKVAESSFAQQPIGSGPFRLVKWERGVSLELHADTARLRPRAGVDRLVIRLVADLNAAARSVTSGESDFVEQVRPEGLAMVTAASPTKAIAYAAPEHGYLLFNLRATTNRKQPHPLLGDRELRRALAMSVNRPAVVRNALDSLAAPSYGPFVSMTWSADTTIPQLEFDTVTAARMLDSAGWRDSNGDGIRERNGRPLRFSLLVPSVSATRRQMATALQEQYRRVGVEVVVDALEPSVLFPRLQQGKFDAFLHIWHEDASPAGVGQAWGGRDLGRSPNFGWYANAAVDSLLDRALTETDMARARGLYREVYTRIVDDAPAVFLWESQPRALMHTRIQAPPLSPHGWWTGIPFWRIPASQRIPRDGVSGS